MTPEASLYLAGPDELTAAGVSVAGRPLALRALMAAVRAGCSPIWVPAALRPLLADAVDASPAARAAVAWGDAGALRPDAPLLLVPAAALAPPGALRAVVAAGSPAVLAASRGRGAPIALVPPASARGLWDRARAGTPLGDEVEGAVAGGTEVAGGWYIRVAAPAEAPAAEDSLYGTLGSPIDTRLDRVFHRRLSRPVSRLAVRWGVCPNHVTLASLVVGIAAAWCFWDATPARAVVALALYAAAVVLDHADGEVARLTLTESRFGERLDVVVDTVVHVLLVLALGTTAQHAAGGGGAAGLVAAAGVVGSAAVTQRAPAGAGRAATALAALGNRDGFYAMLIAFIALRAALPAALPALMIVIAAGCHAFWVAWLVWALQGDR